MQDDVKLARQLFDAHEYMTDGDTIQAIAKALAAERARTVERCAKWHEEQRDKPWSDGAPEELKRAAAYVHTMSAAAIRALGRGK